MEHVYFSNLGGIGHRWELQAMFNYDARYQVLCKNQEEYDLLYGYSLMFGRELELDTWEHWQLRRTARKALGSSLRLLPFVFTTWPNAELRGL